MRKLLTLALCLLSLAGFGQSKQAVDLKWKINANEKLSYATEMSDIDTSTFKMDFGNFFKMLTDSTGKGLNESTEYINKFNQAIQNMNYVTSLANKGNGVIDIVMAASPKEPVKEYANDAPESKETAALKMMQSLNQGVVLRGSVYASGNIHSFWLKNNQKNLIALMFELPTRPVKIGDSWELDISLISNDQNFVCDSSYRVNEVRLMDVKKVKGETIALLSYNIIEYVKGDFYAPAFFGENSGQKETMMKLTYQGIAEFSVDKGRWVSYNGIMGLDATGVMTAKKKTKFALVKK